MQTNLLSTQLLKAHDLDQEGDKVPYISLVVEIGYYQYHRIVLVCLVSDL